MTEKRSRLLFAGPQDRTALWKQAFERIAPAIEFVPLEESLDLAEFSYCLAWNPPPSLWKKLPRLRAIFSLGAGVDRLLRDSHLPLNIAIIRMSEPSLVKGMADYVLWQCLFHHRRFWEAMEAQEAALWKPYIYPEAKDRIVGIMGLGAMGLAAAERLIDFGFRVKGWGRSPKNFSNIAYDHGKDRLTDFLRDVEILVCLLPLTDETAGLLNAEIFRLLPRGACLINAARGEHMIEADLISAMEEGHIAAASLDVFATEPLPPDHAFWSMRRIFITPHNASLTDPEGGARHVATQIDRMERGEIPFPLVDRQRGY